MSSRHSRFAAVLLWGMIPLTAFAGLPRMGCICANGQHKFFCEWCHTADVSVVCTCCHKDADGKRAPGGAPGCCARRQGGPRNGTPSVHSERPCRPVLDLSIFVHAAKAPVPDLDRANHAPQFVAFDPLPERVTSAAADVDRGKLLPPPDLVVTLGVLLI